MVEIDPMDLEKAVLYEGRQCTSICVIISIGKGCCFYQNEHKFCFIPSLVHIWLTGRNSNDGQHVINKAHLSVHPK